MYKYVMSYIIYLQDVEKLASLLGNLKSRHLVDHPTFNHLDFMYGRDADSLVYQLVINSMLEFDNEQQLISLL